MTIRQTATDGAVQKATRGRTMSALLPHQRLPLLKRSSCEDQNLFSTGQGSCVLTSLLMGVPISSRFSFRSPLIGNIDVGPLCERRPLIFCRAHFTWATEFQPRITRITRIRTQVSSFSSKSGSAWVSKSTTKEEIWNHSFGRRVVAAVGNKERISRKATKAPREDGLFSSSSKITRSAPSHGEDAYHGMR